MLDVAIEGHYENVESVEHDEDGRLEPMDFSIVRHGDEGHDREQIVGGVSTEGPPSQLYHFASKQGTLL